MTIAIRKNKFLSKKKKKIYLLFQIRENFFYNRNINGTEDRLMFNQS